MKKKFRLKSNEDYKRVRRSGKSYAHPLVVLIARPNNLNFNRIGVTTGRSLQNAIQRNRAKRLIRAAVRPLFDSILPGYDLVLIGRGKILEKKSFQVQDALSVLLKKAEILQ